LKSQMRRADRSNAKFALLLGEAESEHQTVSVKDLRRDSEQVQVPQVEAADYLKQLAR
jgi:histidyl-tRNA synthetase